MLQRTLLAVAFLLATQLALVHPYEHFEERAHAEGIAGFDAQHPFELAHAQQCDVCASAGGLGFFASSASPLRALEGRADTRTSLEARVHQAAFAPLYRSQAPPATL